MTVLITHWGTILADSSKLVKGGLPTPEPSAATHCHRPSRSDKGEIAVYTVSPAI
ncbi:MAG: hypothetical protein OEV76_03355 [Anaerolineae bacterium]|nr:hypothetical protein [Anaerolineae bacterium]